MKVLSLIFFITFLITGCSDSSNNTLSKQNVAYTVRLAPSLASSAYTPVPVNSKLLLDVSTALNPSTVTQSSVYIQDLSGTRLDANVSLVSNQIILEPLRYLPADTTLEIVVTTAVKTTTGEVLSQNAILSFTSGSNTDTTGPGLITTLPSGSDTPEPFVIIYFQFDETLSPLLDTKLLRVYDPLNDLNVSGTTKFSGESISFIPDSNLTFDKNYTVELNTSSITDLSNNPYSGAALEDFNFTVTSLANAKPIIQPTEVNQTLGLNTTINCIYPLNPQIDLTAVPPLKSDLYFGTESGLSIVTFDLNTTNFDASTYTIRGSLDTTEVGIVYDIDFDTTTNRAYLASSEGVYIIDINNTATPLVINHYIVTDANNVKVPVYGLDQVGTHIYAAATTVGLIDLNISNESNMVELFRADTNGTAFDASFDGTNIYVSDYDQVIKAFDTTGQPVVIPTSSVFTPTHNLLTYYDSASTSQMVMAAGGIRGLDYIDLYNYYSDAISTPSYISQIQYNTFSNSNSFAVLKNIGIVYFTPYYYMASPNDIINDYQILPYDVDSAGYMAYTSEDYSVTFVAESDGTVHAFLIP